MNMLRHTVRCVILWALLAGTPAAADQLDSILGFLVDAGIVDQAIVDAKPLIECLVQSSSPSQCVDLQSLGKDLQSEAVSEAERQAAKFAPDDPAVRAVVDIIRAANSGDWLRVLELTGVKLLGQIACKAGLSWGGPLKAFICGDLGGVVLSKAEPVVHEILVVVKDFPDVNVWKLVSLFGFELACEIVEDEDVPFASEACGVLGAAVAAIMDAGEAVLDAISDGIGAIFGGSGGKSVSPEQFYATNIRPLMYRHALQRLAENRQDLGLDRGEIDACIQRAPRLAPYCAGTFSQNLRKESESLVKLVQSMPGTYVTGFLGDEVRARAVDRYGQAAGLYEYVDKLPPADWASLLDGSTLTLMSGYTGINDADKYYFRKLWSECKFWVNLQLTGNRNIGVPFFSDIAPDSLTNWICYHGAARQFFAAQRKEEQRLATIRQGLNKLGCSTEPRTPFGFVCQSHISFAICVRQSYKDYGKNRYCRADRDRTAQSLGDSLVDALGKLRCRYVARTKGNYGDFDPRVQCSRPWKQQTCDALLTTFRARFDAPSSRIQMRCAYNPDKQFLAEEARAKQILTALTGGAAPAMVRSGGRQTVQAFSDPNRCRTLWDPLAINCPHQTTMPPLPADLATPPIESCRDDPSRNGADRVCYQTVFAAKDSMRELAEGRPLIEAASPQVGSAPAAATTAQAVRALRQTEPSSAAGAALRRAATTVVELEALAGSAVASGGDVIVQPMAGFGPGWGGDAQIFWRPTAAGQTLLVRLAPGLAGTYDLVLHYTAAPDYGNFSVRVNARSGAENLSGFGPGVALRSASLGRHELGPSEAQVLFTVAGRDPSSSGYILGLDRIELKLVDAR